MGLFTTENNYYHKRTELVPYCKEVKITEKKAPTDESIRLLKEMEAEARKKIIQTIHLDNNTVKAIIVCYENSLMMDRVTCHIRFLLNGIEYRAIQDIDRWEWRHELVAANHGFGNEQLLSFFYKQLSEAITKSIISQSPTILSDALSI